MKIVLRSNHPSRGLLNSDGFFIPAHRPACVFVSPLVEQRIAKGDFRMLVGNLADEATDPEFEKFLKDSEDEQLALDSFESKYSLEQNRRRVEETADEKAKREKAEDDAKKAKAEDDAKKAKAEDDAKKAKSEDDAKKAALANTANTIGAVAGAQAGNPNEANTSATKAN